MVLFWKTGAVSYTHLIDGNITGSIEKGLCVLIGIAETDTKEIAEMCIRDSYIVVSYYSQDIK